MSKIKCYACQAFGHYASQCPSKKKKKEQGQQTAASAEVDELSDAFQRDFSLYAGQMERERVSLATSTDMNMDSEHSLLGRYTGESIHLYYLVY